NSQALIRIKNPELTGNQAIAAQKISIGKSLVETPMMRMVRTFQFSLAEDTLHNEYELRPKLLRWLMNGQAPKDLNALNSKVYAELFLTPDSDPWLGLAPADVYTALDHGGLFEPGASCAQR